MKKDEIARIPEARGVIVAELRGFIVIKTDMTSPGLERLYLRQQQLTGDLRSRATIGTHVHLDYVPSEDGARGLWWASKARE